MSEWGRGKGADEIARDYKRKWPEVGLVNNNSRFGLNGGKAVVELSEIRRRPNDRK